jgi:hypothetical protein
MPERSPSKGGEHPTTEALAACVDRTLDERTRAEVETHLARCPECYELVTAVLRAVELEGEPLVAGAQPPVTKVRATLWWLLAALIAVAALILTWR